MILSGSNPFNLTPRQPVREETIESMFMNTRGRSDDVQFLRSIQADVVREYNETHVDSDDVGIELPTGSGKTLVGLLIGEWRRKHLNQRILYLCPTRQLAYQVHELSKEYAIDTCVFVGSKYNFNNTNLSKYQNCDTIAIATYRGLFNVSPGIDDPQTIILDDAHGAESYIGDMYSVKIDRRRHSELYHRILGMFERDLPSRFVEVINGGNRDRITHKIEKVPFGAFNRSLDSLRGVLDSIDDSDLTLYFSWQTLSDGLHACHVYVSFDSILIRPYIPTTLNHRPFSNAVQRVYMSATLGRGGELERITGINRIEKISTPAIYENRVLGRRLYLFPDYSMEPDEYYPWVINRILREPRTLVLCPGGYNANQYREFAKAVNPEITIFTADDIEETLTRFTESSRSILLLTNRYDGIDLPDDACRQVIMDGLPISTNLQESFLEDRLGLSVLLRERVKTRIEQASGRCTRAENDIAALLMLDRKLMNFCSRAENQRVIQSELRTEIKFGLRQDVSSVEKLNSLMDIFMNRSEFWQEAEAHLDTLRDTEHPPESEEAIILDSVVYYEVDYTYAMWNEDYERAVDRGRRVSELLTLPSLKSYRALWYYFTAIAASKAVESNGDFRQIRNDYLAWAKAAGRYVSWFPYAIRSLEAVAEEPAVDVERTALAVEGIINTLQRLGATGPRFNRKLNEVESLLQKTQASQFDFGMRELGLLLGYSSQKPPGEGAPDACWHLENNILFVFEGKSDENPDAGISIDTCRQTQGHLLYADDRDNYQHIQEKYLCLVTPRTTLMRSASPHGEGIHHLNVSEMQTLFERTRDMLTEARTLMSSEVTDNLRESISQILERYDLTPTDIQTYVTSTKILDLPLVD